MTTNNLFTNPSITTQLESNHRRREPALPLMKRTSPREICRPAMDKTRGRRWVLVRGSAGCKRGDPLAAGNGTCWPPA